MIEHILLTGDPKSGKSTLLRRVLEQLKINKHGFLTEEITVAGIRNGFKMIASNDQRALLATTHLPTNLPVSRYFVQLHNLDQIVTSLLPLPESGILYIDEIGQMQLYSKDFIELAKQFLDSNLSLIGTVSSIYNHPFIDEIKKRSDVEIITVTPENRDQLVEELVTRLSRSVE